MIKLKTKADINSYRQDQIVYTTQEHWDVRGNDPDALLRVWKKLKDVGVYHKRAIARVKWFEVVID